MLRYEVTHPVINDRNMVLWRALGVSSWPTLVVVSPKGRVIATLAGEQPHTPFTARPMLAVGSVAHVRVQLFVRWRGASDWQQNCFGRSWALVQLLSAYLRHAVQGRSAAMWCHGPS